MKRMKSAVATVGVLGLIAGSLFVANQLGTHTEHRSKIVAADNAPFANGEKVVIDGQVSYVSNAVTSSESNPNAAVKAPDAALGPLDIEEDEAEELVEERREASLPKFNSAAFNKPDPVIQKRATTGSTGPSVAAIPSPTAGFEGIGNGVNYSVRYAPPDTTMDVSPTQIVQAVNVVYMVLNKDGTTAQSPRGISSLFSSGPCSTMDDGDPTVVYDRINNRWIISQFAVSGSPFYQCVAVSRTSNATGSYYTYAFDYNFFPDYPKLSVWPGSYFTTFNGFTASGSWYGSVICAYDMAKMLTGAAATQRCTSPDTANGSPLVASYEGGTAPTLGTSAYAIGLNRSTPTAMNIWRLSVDWANSGGLTPTRSTFTVPAFALACSGGGACIPQSGSSIKLDSLGDRLMYRFVYRNVGGTARFVASHSASVGKSISAVRWYLLSPSGSSLAVDQAGTFSPDTKHRWMPSISIDKQGNLAMVYSTSSSSTFPSIAVAGRLASDTANQLGQGEVQVKAGGGSQVPVQGRKLSRWGDYSAMVVDPNDGCTFWSSTEYLPSNGAWNWRTWISKFKYPGCN